MSPGMENVGFETTYCGFICICWDLKGYETMLGLLGGVFCDRSSGGECMCI